MNMHFRHKFAVDGLIQASRDFHAFSGAVAQGDAQSKGKAFERLTQLYLQAAPEYRAVLKSVWLWDEVPPHVKNALKLPNPDLGIDIVAETVSGEYWGWCRWTGANEPTRFLIV